MLNALISDKECLAGISSIVRDILSGYISDCCRPLLLSRILIAVDKDNGGKRPIAMGDL